jgi:hypothetical protein
MRHHAERGRATTRWRMLSTARIDMNPRQVDFALVRARLVALSRARWSP